ncbi:hypothetical protein HK098_003928 [Nowakowskiella sp. JEL0407]|nr:hypothetical protein HK098_003928 [Nowakowskiella sp. JEL0407]
MLLVAVEMIKIRQISPLERYYIARHNLSYYATVTCPHRLSISLSKHTSSDRILNLVESTLRDAANSLLELNPRLGYLVGSPHKQPYFYTLPSDDVQPTVTVISRTSQIAASVPEDNELWRILDSEVNELYNFDAKAFLWRIKLLVPPTRNEIDKFTFDVIFSVHHCLCDGLSALKLSEDLMAIFTHSLVKLPVPIQPKKYIGKTMEEHFPIITPTIFTYLKLILFKLLPLVGIQYNLVSTGFKSNKHKVFDKDRFPCRLVSFKIANLQEIHTMCRKNQTTINGFLTACALIAIDRVLGEREQMVGHAVSVRDMIPQIEDEPGIFIQGTNIMMTVIGDETVWELAKVNNKKMKENRMHGLYEVGYLQMLGDLPNSLSFEGVLSQTVSKRENGGLFGTSNAGKRDLINCVARVLPQSESNDEAIVVDAIVEDGWFAQSSYPGGSIFMLSIVGVNDSLNCCFTVRDDWYFGVEDTERIKHELLNVVKQTLNLN